MFGASPCQSTARTTCVDRPRFAPASGLACRIPFGIAGVLATATALYAVSRRMRARRAGAGDIDR
jgi:hypothetical protein